MGGVVDGVTALPHLALGRKKVVLRSMFEQWKPKLEKVGLSWVDFHVMRRTCSSQAEALGASAKVISDQQGHGLNVHMEVYTKSSLEQKLEAVEMLESAFVN